MPWNAERGQNEDAGEPGATIQQDGSTCFTYAPGRESGNVKHARKVISDRTRQEHQEKLADLSDTNQRSKRYIYREDRQPTAPAPTGDDNREQPQHDPK